MFSIPDILGGKSPQEFTLWFNPLNMNTGQCLFTGNSFMSLKTERFFKDEETY